jgi:glycosyltransferase involved in cell wall biosynthesis
MDRQHCRRRLELPLNKQLIGYLGGIHPSRGIDLVFRLQEQLYALDSNIELVLSGRLAHGVRIPPTSHWLGYRAPEEVPLIMNALDLLLVVNKPSSFGNFSYPIKLYEAMNCRLPVVASDLPGTTWVLGDHTRFLARADSPEDFVQKARAALSLKDYDYGDPSTWSSVCDVFENRLLQTGEDQESMNEHA